VVVVGAAGYQGAAAVRHLRSLAVETRALFDERDERRRDRGGDESGTLVADFDDPGSLTSALHGAGALIVVLEDPATGPDDRLRHGRALADAALEAEVGRLVFVAATGADHHRLACDVSTATEQHLREIGAPATVLRPATFMEEVPWYWLSRLGRDLTLATPFEAGAHLPLVALEDVGVLAALAVTRPEEFADRTIAVAGDIATPLELVAQLSAGLCEPVRHEAVQVEGVFIYQEASTPVHDIDWLRSVHPGLRTFAGWLDDGGLDLCRRRLEAAKGGGRGTS